MLQGNKLGLLKQKCLVQLDWVSTEDGSHILTVGVGTKILAYCQVSSEVHLLYITPVPCCHLLFYDLEVIIIIIIKKRISRAPVYHTRWERMAFYNNTNNTHSHTHAHVRAHTHMYVCQMEG